MQLCVESLGCHFPDAVIVGNRAAAKEFDTGGISLAPVKDYAGHRGGCGKRIRFEMDSGFPPHIGCRMRQCLVR